MLVYICMGGWVIGWVWVWRACVRNENHVVEILQILMNSWLKPRDGGLAKIKAPGSAKLKVPLLILTVSR